MQHSAPIWFPYMDVCAMLHSVNWSVKPPAYSLEGDGEPTGCLLWPTMTSCASTASAVSHMVWPTAPGGASMVSRLRWMRCCICLASSTGSTLRKGHPNQGS